MKQFARLLCALLGAVSVCVAAAPVTWTLSDVVFNDGGTALGSFVYDASTKTFSNIDITTTPGTIRDGATYHAPTGIGNATTADFIEPALPVIADTSERLVLFLETPLTNVGGVVGIREGLEFTCLDFACTFALGTEPGLDLRRTLTGGSLTAPLIPPPIPEPGSLALAGLALVALAWRGAARRPARERLAG